ncbi:MULTISPECIES: NUDIX hydrolase [Chryseobacterium]|uniref:NAD+ diphosphatase n=1 Tax=Chryseobacterium camelliae TaxID=1265445 RepID=A0ABU0TLN3_9FLAO|nr:MULTISPECIES: NUDIX domain-containing protein [Chryseobacterium]MDT3408184.1 NAD+ diphosphatase [Pseudacidovorax intermedius]MDQ1097962.1 NAD+ diphosphatase [Chryseobacterium camelliae]MDQ1101893.1 NAD+ diphosphatase [Chryseobacterium sp. SORGH_AS_1048]MDR6085333.1 NAD+ diphosphatase [Chryseobacterium sp. SORGH_AS_0909]MDR6129691.1 NAD+ diphosphatase [Chryseobacterium sp. SORGH_AS_1175]
MKELPYCPECGQKTLRWYSEKKWSCTECSFTLYHNVAGAVAVVIRHGNEIYLTRRNREPAKGLLDLAGGFVDPRESAEETCKRELSEELNIEIDSSRLRYITSLPNVYHYKGIDYNTIDLFYEYEIQEKFEENIELQEISEGLWIPMNQLRQEDLAFSSQKKFFEKYLKNN